MMVPFEGNALGTVNEVRLQRRHRDQEMGRLRLLPHFAERA